MFTSFRVVIGSTLFRKVGEREPDTWDDLLRAGRKLRSSAIPSGLPIARPPIRSRRLIDPLVLRAKDIAEDGRRYDQLQGDGDRARVRAAGLTNEAMDPAVSRGTTRQQ